MRRTGTAVSLALAVTLLSAHAAAGNTVVWTSAHELAPAGLFDPTTAGDLDGDGDDDVASFGYRREYWNTGCPGPPVWQLEEDVFPNASGCTEGNGALGDCDSDGDLDLIYSCWECCSFRMVWNIGTSQAPTWQSAEDVPGGPYAGNDAQVCLGDMDGDGDLDLVSTNAGGSIRLAQNVGTLGAPYWPVTVLIPDIGFGSSDGQLALGDLDADGDLDLVGATHSGRVRCWENIGTPQAWSYVRNDAMLTGVAEPTNSISGLALPDVDCDGDLDLLISTWTGPYLYLNERITAVGPGSWGTIKALYR